MSLRVVPRRSTRAESDAAEHAGTRARILEAALDVFAEYGFDGTSTREICKRANVNVAALNYHWGSKESLWLAVCDAVARQVMRLTRECLDVAQPVEVAVPKLIGTMFDALLVDPRPIRIGMWASMQAESMDFPGVFQTFAPWFRMAVQYFSRLAQEGRIRTIDVEVMLSLFYGQFAQAFLDQPSQRQYFGKDLSDPEHAARVRKSVIDTAMILLGLDGARAMDPKPRSSAQLQSVPARAAAKAAAAVSRNPGNPSRRARSASRKERSS